MTTVVVTDEIKTICSVKFFNNQNIINKYIGDVRLLPIGLFVDGSC